MVHREIIIHTRFEGKNMFVGLDPKLWNGLICIYVPNGQGKLMFITG